MSVQLLRLVTGEEVVAEASLSGSLGQASWTLKKPAKIVMTHEGLGMMPLSPFMKNDEVTVDKAHVMFTAEPEEEILNAYNAQFGSGIVLARNL